jgi:hypothetical protein
MITAGPLRGLTGLCAGIREGPHSRFGDTPLAVGRAGSRAGMDTECSRSKELSVDGAGRTRSVAIKQLRIITISHQPLLKIDFEQRMPVVLHSSSLADKLSSRPRLIRLNAC